MAISALSGLCRGNNRMLDFRHTHKIIRLRKKLFKKAENEVLTDDDIDAPDEHCRFVFWSWTVFFAWLGKALGEHFSGEGIAWTRDHPVVQVAENDYGENRYGELFGGEKQTA